MEYKAKFYSIRHLKSGMHLTYDVNPHVLTQDINHMYTPTNRDDVEAAYRRIMSAGWNGYDWAITEWTMSWEDDR